MRSSNQYTTIGWYSHELSDRREIKYDYSRFHSQCPYFLAVSLLAGGGSVCFTPNAWYLLPRYIYMALGSVTADLVLVSILISSCGGCSVVPRVLEAEKYRAVVVCSEHELWVELLVIGPRFRYIHERQHTKNHMDAPRPRAATA